MGITYEQSGVDINAGNLLINRIREPLQSTSRPEVLHSIGGFASLAALPTKFKDPLIVCSTDGVGTKLKLAIKYDFHESIGQDLVAMCVNDVLVYGAEPFLFLDYFATGKLNVDVAERVIRGIADACRQTGCSLAGGETAELPGMYAHSDYDVAGFCIGLVERSDYEQRPPIAKDDILLGLSSDGPHSNGFSLIRKLLEEVSGQPPNEIWQELTKPTKLYVNDVLSVAGRTTGMAHVTGGGLVENPPRMLTSGLAVELDLRSWQRPACFEWLNRIGQLEPIEMLRTFNCGIGFLLAVREEHVDAVKSQLTERGETVSVVGRIVDAGTQATRNKLIVDKDLNISLG
ncbi:MAG: phosphoribosylformylglycinamidine cyclo-ligase [Gammaproteobacteria bacterium]|nr:phosphoribosylformylglycinamidine cyclo-ligase [Gammaproteobacteria bacterium]MXX94455.1 phosphoribosylformylglycinamidine cyclo-ligase [Gammaproteobacteria bacterium]MYF52288.1 phosphoribosylformylglycinamidine cyclo-ligase [Gammaproteobacteria bacterium]MYK42705.1 phosphoribosylformylglycinamidine cyclo-ligase [Gammaproteobacteria bacterium]